MVKKNIAVKKAVKKVPAKKSASVKTTTGKVPVKNAKVKKELLGEGFFPELFHTTLQ